MSYKCLLFDLDGTLVDSRADLANSVNLMLVELGLRALPSVRVLNFVGEGARLLVERSLAASTESEPLPSEVDYALKVYQRHYGEHLLDETCVYPEVTETLARLDYLPKAIVTNKPYGFSVALLEGLGMLSQFKTVLGGDSLPERKPSPMMLLEAARGCGVEPAECLMVGDTKFDVTAGRAAKMKTCGYIPGFRGRTELAEAGADFLIERFSELQVLVESAKTKFAVA
ncbi:MAG: HAD-IA family hydrolase [Acidobacteriota bacterium]|nr:HAD-IA family hydrolase [Acidobacteriota bacterium]